MDTLYPQLWKPHKHFIPHVFLVIAEVRWRDAIPEASWKKHGIFLHVLVSVSKCHDIFIWIVFSGDMQLASVTAKR